MKNKSVDLTVIVLTKNEELHIERCIKSLNQITKNIFIVDSGSTDNTVAIAEELGAICVYNPWINYASQFNWALENCKITTEWVMRFDADEYLTDDLIDEISFKLPCQPKEVGGVYLKRRHYFLGKWIKHGGRYPLSLLRIWRKGKATIENRWMDEHMILSEGVTATFENDFIDDNLNTVDWFIEKHNKYATREMLDILNRKYKWFNLDNMLVESEKSQASIKRFIKEKIYNKFPIFFRPFLYFLYRYFFALGFLDGVQGFAYHFMQGFWYRCLVDLKCFELERIISKGATKEDVLSIISKHTGLKINDN